MLCSITLFRKIAEDYADKQPIIVTVSILSIPILQTGTASHWFLLFSRFQPFLWTHIELFDYLNIWINQILILQTLKGATIFASDLVRAIHPVPDGLELGFVRASSYGAGTQTTGKVTLGITTLKDEDIVGRHLLLVS